MKLGIEIEIPIVNSEGKSLCMFKRLPAQDKSVEHRTICGHNTYIYHDAWNMEMRTDPATCHAWLADDIYSMLKKADEYAKEHGGTVLLKSVVPVDSKELEEAPPGATESGCNPTCAVANDGRMTVPLEGFRDILGKHGTVCGIHVHYDSTVAGNEKLCLEFSRDWCRMMIPFIASYAGTKEVFQRWSLTDIGQYRVRPYGIEIKDIPVEMVRSISLWSGFIGLSRWLATWLDTKHRSYIPPYTREHLVRFQEFMDSLPPFEKVHKIIHSSVSSKLKRKRMAKIYEGFRPAMHDLICKIGGCGQASPSGYTIQSHPPFHTLHSGQVCAKDHVKKFALWEATVLGRLGEDGVLPLGVPHCEMDHKDGWFFGETQETHNKGTESGVTRALWLWMNNHLGAKPVPRTKRAPELYYEGNGDYKRDNDWTGINETLKLGGLNDGGYIQIVK